VAEVAPQKAGIQTDALGRPAGPSASAFPQYFAALTVVLGITLPCFLLRPLVGYRPIGLIYLCVVVLLALFVGRGPTLAAAAVSALFWDFFFMAPITKLRIANAEDGILLVAYVVVALVLGQLTTRIRLQEQSTRQGEERTRALYLLVGELAGTNNLEELAQVIVKQTGAAFGAQMAVLLPDISQAPGYRAHPASTYDLPGPEQPIVQWVFEHAQAGGKFTANFHEAKALFVPLSAGGRPIGVLGLAFAEDSPPSRQQTDLLAGFAQQIALALERQRLREDSEKGKLLAESERLSKTLLNSMSHEIRTPLAAIQGAIANLLEMNEPEFSPAQQSMVTEIQDASQRLNRLVGKVLDITRLESGRVKPKLTWCDVSDLVHMAVKDTKRELVNHPLAVQVAPGLPLVFADFVLLQEALKNLLSNAGCHTPAGTAVELSARVANGALVLGVADSGPGIDPASLPRLFGKFYRAPTAGTGGTGLGLSLVKGFVEAQGGEVTAENRAGGGAVFTIRLPLRQTRSGAMKSTA
jgi:two-component system, OmpR family, sensor histidine kinase KdpD